MMVLSENTVTAKNALSSEEDDILLRSAKKVKNGADHLAALEDCMAVEEWPKLSLPIEKPWLKGQSFVEKLQGISRREAGEGHAKYSTAMHEDDISDTISLESDKEDMVSGSRVQKGGAKKKEGKSQGLPVVSTEKNLGKQVQRKEKRLRELVREEKKVVNIPSEFNAKVRGAAYYLIDADAERDRLVKDVGPDVEVPPGSEIFHDLPPDPEVSRMEGLEGKFWSGSSSFEPEMASNEIGPSGLGEGTIVPDSQ
ncbi:hypothetical protein K1719_038186 [Acacia pycnantha]|nr:hypothetical protein K1719_038186 [Acacia pycnantha]